MALFVSCSKDSEDNTERLFVNSASEIQGKWSRLENMDLVTYEFSGNTWKSRKLYSKDLSTTSLQGTFSISKGKITFTFEKNIWRDEFDKTEPIEWSDDLKKELLIDKKPYHRD